MTDKYLSLSPFLYCADNPMKYVDPNGGDFDLWSWIFPKEDKQKKQEAERGAEMPQAMDTPKMMETAATVNNALEQTAINMQNAAVNAAEKVEPPLAIGGAAIGIAAVSTGSAGLADISAACAIAGISITTAKTLADPSPKQKVSLYKQIGSAALGYGLSKAFTPGLNIANNLYLTETGAKAYKIAGISTATTAGLISITASDRRNEIQVYGYRQQFIW